MTNFVKHDLMSLKEKIKKEGRVGLPRYLKDKYKNGDIDRVYLLIQGVENKREIDSDKTARKSHPLIRVKENEVIEITENNYQFYAESLIKFALKLKYGYTKKSESVEIDDIRLSSYNYNDLYKYQFVKNEVFWFTRLKGSGGKYKTMGRILKVNDYFWKRANSISEKREHEAREEIRKQQEIRRIKNAEQGRTFERRLRYLIMQRDNFRCVYCGRSAKEGAILEVDHIVAWVDGGRTIYENGQTVCSDCNKAKHHVKKYNQLVEEMEKASGE